MVTRATSFSNCAFMTSVPDSRKTDQRRDGQCTWQNGAPFGLFPHRLASGEIRKVEVHSGPIMVDGRYYLSPPLTSPNACNAEELFTDKHQRLEKITGTRRHPGVEYPAGTAVLNSRWAEMIGYTRGDCTVDI